MSAIATLLTTANELLNEHTSHREAAAAAALEAANQALRLANEQDRPDLAARAELLRGHAFRDRGQWTLANECYERAKACSSSVLMVVGGVVVTK